MRWRRSRFRYDGEPDGPFEEPDTDNGESMVVVTFIAAPGVTFSDASATVWRCDPDGADCVARAGGDADPDGIARISSVTFQDENEDPGRGGVQWLATVGGQVCSNGTDNFAWPVEGVVEVDAVVDPAEANYFCIDADE